MVERRTLARRVGRRRQVPAPRAKGTAMYLDYTPEQQALRRELRAYFGRLVTPEYQAELSRSEGGGPLYMQAVRKLGADGWLGIGWPTEYGGQGRSPIEQFIFFDEAARAGVMLPTLTINAVAPAIMQYGTPAQKAEYLPRILGGEVHFAIGYTEPSAGTDLASLKTRAVRDGDEWVIDGTKVFTSQAEYADYIWLAARTDPNAPKHPHPCSRVHRGGLRQRVLRRGLPPAARGAGRDGRAQARLARRRPAGPRGAHVPRHAHPHLRGRHQRDAARHHRDGGALDAPLALRALMDFSFTPEPEALREPARRLLEDHVTAARLKAVEAAPDGFDRAAWHALAEARLLGVALPEDDGGSGLGVLELCLLPEQVGRAVAPVPVFPTLVLGALAIAESGTAEQRRRWLPGVTTGEVVLTAALVEPGADDPEAPATAAARDGASWRLDGVKTCVPAAQLAARVLVPARLADGSVGIFLVDPRGRGCTLERQVATNREPQARLVLDGAPGDVLPGANVGWLVERALVGLAAMQLGVTERALRLTAEYTARREQFDRPIASFQAVHQRAADAYIDVEAIRLTTWQAAWRLAAGLPATAEVAVAKFWASEAAHRVVYAAQHLHGGIGVDLDYPLHRYYLWAKQIELTLGSGTRQLVRLGAELAARPPDG